LQFIEDSVNMGYIWQDWAVYRIPQCIESEVLKQSLLKRSDQILISTLLHQSMNLRYIVPDQ